MQLTVGRNRMRDTNGVISIRGHEQIVFEWGALQSQLLLTMDLYDVSGHHVARLRRNHWTFNDRDRFTFATSETGVSLTDTRSSEIVLEARIVGDDSVAVTRGVFNSSTGRQIEINVEDWDGAENAKSGVTRTAESTEATFTEQETGAIRAAMMSSQDTVQCPRCSAPLTRSRLPRATQHDAWLVSCIMCGRNVVVSSKS